MKIDIRKNNNSKEKKIQFWRYRSPNGSCRKGTGIYNSPCLKLIKDTVKEIKSKQGFEVSPGKAF